MTKLRSISVRNHGYKVEVPDPCPICHRHSQLEIVKAGQTNHDTSVQVIYRCAYSGCRSFFIGYYGMISEKSLLSVKPIKPVVSQFHEVITKLSPTFIEVFTEAEEASQMGLAQIAGPGYRKAFEFLIKDYANSLAPDKTGDIEKKFSGTVVSEFITDTRIQAVAKRALWLGNDETHYLRKWTDHGINDLVTLINLTAKWIEIEHLSESYVKEIPG